MVFTSNSVGLSPKKCFKLIFRLTKLICMTFEAIANDITRFQTQLKVVVSDLRTAPLNRTPDRRSLENDLGGSVGSNPKFWIIVVTKKLIILD